MRRRTTRYLRYWNRSGIDTATDSVCWLSTFHFRLDYRKSNLEPVEFGTQSWRCLCCQWGSVQANAEDDVSQHRCRMRRTARSYGLTKTYALLGRIPNHYGYPKRPGRRDRYRDRSTLYRSGTIWVTARRLPFRVWKAICASCAPMATAVTFRGLNRIRSALP